MCLFISEYLWAQHSRVNYITSYSYPFTTIIQKDGTVILRPMLTVILRYGSKTFPTELLLDSGADYSILRYDTAKYGLNIPVKSLPECKLPLKGITSEPQDTVRCENVSLTFKYGAKEITTEIFAIIMIDEEKQPSRNLLGRDPFFYNFRVDFRMGYTEDKSLGKYILYHEDKKRSAKRYHRPRGRQIR